MSVISKTPQLVNTAQDPALEYLNQRETYTVNVITPVLDKTPVVPITQLVTNVFQVNAPQGANGSIQFNENGSYIGDSGLQFEPTSDTLTTGIVIANSITINNSLKLSGGNNRNFLTTDGTGNTSWADVLPSRAGNTGKFLVTNGVSDEWSTVSYSTFATQTDVSNAINTLVGTAPGILDTLGEIANVIGQTNNPEYGIISQLANKANISSLADVAFSGSYIDLEYKPTISTVGTTGNYADIHNLPTIPVSIMDFGISDGSNGQVLTAYGNGHYHFTTVTSGGGASTGNITFSDTTLTGTGDVKIHFTPSASPAVEFNFASNGSLTLPGTLNVSGGDAPSITGPDGIKISTADGKPLMLDWQAAAVNPYPGVPQLSTSVALVSLSYSGVIIEVNDAVGGNYWTFGPTGKLKLPPGGDIVDSEGASQFISVTSLKTLVAASTDFADFQTRIAAL